MSGYSASSPRSTRQYAFTGQVVYSCTVAEDVYWECNFLSLSISETTVSGIAMFRFRSNSKATNRCESNTSWQRLLSGPKRILKIVGALPPSQLNGQVEKRRAAWVACRANGGRWATARRWSGQGSPGSWCGRRRTASWRLCRRGPVAANRNKHRLKRWSGSTRNKPTDNGEIYGVRSYKIMSDTFCTKTC